MSHWSTVMALLIGMGLQSGPPASPQPTPLEALALAEARWKQRKPTSYEIDIEVRCFCAGLSARAVSVRVDGAEAQFVPELEPAARRAYSYYNSIDKLFAAIRSSMLRGAYRNLVEYDPEFGYPLKADLDPRRDVFDEELFFKVSGFRKIGVDPPQSLTEWEAADNATVRLAPTVFVNLPLAIRVELVRLGCTIPQPHTVTRPTNVIEGRFTSAKQMDWAVLCSRGRRSSILVFRGGVPSNVVELAPQDDRDHLQTIDGARTIGYSREIAVATSRSIQEQHARHGGPKPPAMDHAGINDAFTGKASVVWYFYRDRWLKLQGAD